MSTTYVDGLPLPYPWQLTALSLTVRVHGLFAYVESRDFVARVSLQTGNVDWLVERPAIRIPNSEHGLPRSIDVSGTRFWVSESGQHLAEIKSTECGGLLVLVRNAETGKQLWEHFVPIPEPAPWTESSPAWRGAQTEEIDALIADDPTKLSICLARQTRRSCIATPSEPIEARTVPPYACQTDVIRFDHVTGAPLWRAEFPDVHVGLGDRHSFSGIWKTGQRIGAIDFEAGTNTVYAEMAGRLGRPVSEGSTIAVSWSNGGRVGIDWFDDQGNQIQTSRWRHPHARETNLHVTEAGLALQVNDQTLSWLGENDQPMWSVRAKPWIYNVHRSPRTNVFVGTDGNGGRLFAFDADTGHETLNLKPAIYGVGGLTKVPGHEALVCAFVWKKPMRRRLLVLSMKDQSYRLDEDCAGFLGTWEHGALCTVGTLESRLAIFDIR